MNPSPSKSNEIAKKLTAWLMNPIEIDHSDPMGEFKARNKQAEDMANLVAQALQTARRMGMEEAAKIAETCERALFITYAGLETMERDIKVREQQRKEIAKAIRQKIESQ
jgi:hypothetical protein